MVENIKIESIFQCENSQGHDVTHVHLSVVKEDSLSSKTQVKPEVVIRQEKVYCSLCHASFARQDQLKRHMQCLHTNYNSEGEETQGKSEEVRQAKVYCSLCHATFARQDHLKRHMRYLHANFQFCKCPACNRQYTNEAAVKKHIYVSHSNKETVFKCRVCQLLFNSFSKLSEHEAVHHLETHLQCPHCPTQIKRRDHMLRHIKSKHLNQQEVCKHCGLTYKRKDHLIKHMREKHQAILDQAAEANDVS